MTARRWTLALLALLAVIAGASPARAESAKRREARIEYETGIRKFDLGKYDDAAEHFQRAYELIGDPIILFNTAQSFRLGRRYDKALQFYRSFLRRAGAIPNRAEVDKRVAEMEARLAEEERAAREPEREPMTPREVPVAATTAPPSPPPAGPPRRIPVLRYLGFVSGGLTLVALGVGVAGSVLASSAATELERAAAAREPFSLALRDTEARGRSFDTVAIASYAAAGVFAVGAGVLLYLGYRPERPRASSSTALVPYAGPGGAGLLLSGRM